MGQREKVDCMQLQLIPWGAMELRRSFRPVIQIKTKVFGLWISNTNHHRGRDISGEGIKVLVKQSFPMEGISPRKTQECSTVNIAGSWRNERPCSNKGSGSSVTTSTTVCEVPGTWWNLNLPELFWLLFKFLLILEALKAILINRSFQIWETWFSSEVTHPKASCPLCL